MDFVNVFMDHVARKYASMFVSLERECPYYTDFPNEEHRFKQVMVWVATDRLNDSGRTVLEEFVEKAVAKGRLTPWLAAKVLQMKHPINDEFVVREEMDSGNRITVSSITSGKTYRVEMNSGFKELYPKGSEFIGLIHPWHGDGTYRANGITMRRLPPGVG